MDSRVKNESLEPVISNRHLIVGWKSGDEEASKKAATGANWSTRTST